jgi:hypothetical protein
MKPVCRHVFPAVLKVPSADIFSIECAVFFLCRETCAGKETLNEYHITTSGRRKLPHFVINPDLCGAQIEIRSSTTLNAGMDGKPFEKRLDLQGASHVVYWKYICLKSGMPLPLCMIKLHTYFNIEGGNMK